MKGLEKYSSDISKLCAAHKVKRLYVFGSVLTPQFNSSSDVDFIVDFETIDLSQYADNYYDLKFSLQDILHRNIDLLEEKAIKNPYFLKSIIAKRQLVYGH
ncbi:MAG: nucleotidyltransferase domain-containing protein [Chitinophagaceae bacterium]